MTALMNLPNPVLISTCKFGDPENIHTQPQTAYILPHSLWKFQNALPYMPSEFQNH